MPAQLKQEQGAKTNLVNVNALTLQNTVASALVGFNTLSAIPSNGICQGILLILPVGVSLYAAYPFKLHNILSLPWDVCISNHQLRLQSTFCMETAGRDAC